MSCTASRARGEIDAVLDALMEKAWVVYSRPCPGRAETVVNYLGRYTHRIAISDERIVAASETHVSFRCKDYRADGARHTLTLERDDFIRRYLLHVLPKGLRLGEIREAIGVAHPRPHENEKAARGESEDRSSVPCPRCRLGRLECRGRIAPRRAVRRLSEG